MIERIYLIIGLALGMSALIMAIHINFKRMCRKYENRYRRK